jgi:hypothetical protein
MNIFQIEPSLTTITELLIGRKRSLKMRSEAPTTLEISQGQLKNRDTTNIKEDLTFYHTPTSLTCNPTKAL